MSGFDDILDDFDEITEPEKAESDRLTVSEVEAKTGMWNAQDDGDAWTADAGPRAWDTSDPNEAWKSGPVDDSKRPEVGPMSVPDPLDDLPDDDWVKEDAVLDDFLDGEDSVDIPSDEGSGAFDDIF